ncbi:unnamed protein product [Meloidogyne enterolobii]|uniref:Uncharacterized protein n=1 Tax=Meloidogyne enterolobii TaxID=390850 RepID=A0ACB0ZJ69_MELEN
MRAELLYIAECNNFESDLHILTGIVDEKMKRNDIVKKYCDLTKNYTKIRDKRESKGLTRSENKLEHYFKILNLDWLNDQQREYLKNMPSKGIREALRDAVVNWFNHLHPAAKELATDLFKGGCNKLLRIRQEGCGYFGLLDTQKINELKNYDDLTTYNEINELINPLREKLELRKIANDYNQTCRELFGIGEEEGCGYFGSLDTQKINELKNYDDLTTYNKINELINPLREKLELREIATDYNQTCKELFGIGEEEEWRGGRRKRRSHNKRSNLRVERETEDLVQEVDDDYILSVIDGEVTINKRIQRPDGQGAELKDTRTSLEGIPSRKRRHLSSNEDEFKKRKMRESLETILEIHSFWLTNRQEEELREDLKNGKSLDGEIYEKVYLWLLSLELTEMKEAASDVFKRCNGFSLEVIEVTVLQRENHLTKGEIL